MTGPPFSVAVTIAVLPGGDGIAGSIAMEVARGAIIAVDDGASPRDSKG